MSAPEYSHTYLLTYLLTVDAPSVSAKFTPSLDKFHQLMSLSLLFVAVMVIVCGGHRLWPSLSNPMFTFVDQSIVESTHINHILQI